MPKALKDCLPFFIFFTLLTVLVRSNGFFWDAILQGSKYAWYYFETNFEQLIVPASLDAGHPPLFGLYLAGVWKLFGPSLVVSHFAMLPFLLGIVWQVYRLIDYFAIQHQFWILLLVVTNTILLGHGVLVSPDIVFLFCFLLALNGILYLKKWQIILGTMGLGLLSIRGLFALVALMGIHFKIDQKLKPMAVFLPAILALGAYYIFHYLETGWLLSTPNEGWSHHRGIGGPKEIFRNGIILGWRLVDFGNLGLWVLFFLLFLKSRRLLGESRMRLLFSIPLIILLCYAPALLLFKNPIGHRYLLPFYILFALLVAVWLMQSRFNKPWIFALVLAVQLSGNFWVYPRAIAKGWDCTLAHLPYYGLMDDMKMYLMEKGIDPQTVGTEFPNIGARKNIDLDLTHPGFVQKDLTTQSYLLYSNVFNDFSDEELNALDTEWEIIQQYSAGQVDVILYQKNIFSHGKK